MSPLPISIVALTALVTVFGEKVRPYPSRTEEVPKREVPQVIDSGSRQLQKNEVVGKALPKHVAELNSVLFAGNALQRLGGGSEEWIVAFCPSWWEPCGNLEQIFSEEAVSWQARLNSDDFSAKVRFAKVDCASDKVLCNEQGVESYPTIAHYLEGQQVRKISLSTNKKMKGNLASWLSSQLLREEGPDPPQSLDAGGWDVGILLLALLASLRMAGSSPDLQQNRKAVRREEAMHPKKAASPDTALPAGVDVGFKPRTLRTRADHTG
eukprot:CAMPEP_0197653312 /NCGR_PEP_ID=MMETSP1338-20131121/34978_1 /TAXON_ID=43686 ORGANISM="Pelagodinium beii, Strain RCC1491" /NCGR_SAMPLE_ID=MMETSP1338 /ASSEMBLY_ACC=CAM_ASM_000754 /LENGTH=266 /DNA_ID=CAMNT_0043228365 /DNA_START=92 /DNA_END=889 /DNA_ORIENTATION=-